MTWLQFIIWIAGLYTLYYLLLILLDLSGKDRGRVGAAMSHELTFAETVEVQKFEPEAEPVPDNKQATAFSNERVIRPNAEPEIIGSGGISLKTLFSMARDESVLYTRPVSF
ncbi:MAG TPA: hypothetical protein ENO28_05295 [Bacteroidetes bacterium]|nr:hypothetical protein [Bacteroidota bacterium]